MTGRLRHVVLGIINKLVPSPTTEEQKFYLLNIVIQSYGYDAVAVLLFLVLSKYDFSIYCLKCFEHLDIIKAELENACPGVVSCVDLLVVAAYESVILAGGPFYLAHTGRKDSNRSFSQLSYELPSPLYDLSINIARFATGVFTDKEIITLLGTQFNHLFFNHYATTDPITINMTITITFFIKN
uniref:peroxidase n=1 Tax=Lactuca sativa TaxID=4236 RepID=A0A9R1WQT0_LACSA|nr:hypothetical protein LSAT_V11C900455760 [Lactuca sativa]